MKVSKKLLTILSVVMFLYGFLALVFAILYQPKPEKIENITEIQVSDLGDSSVVYFDRLNVVQRYAFQTIDEYEDSESGYSDVTYRVYDASQPMDRYDLHSEYYIVSFSDKSGTEYITSMSVYAEKSIRDVLSNTPVTIPACVTASRITGDSAFLNTNDKELIQLRETVLDAYAQQTGIARADIRLSYQSSSTAQYLQDFEQDTSSGRISAAVLGVILIGIGLFLLRLRKRKAAPKNQADC